MGCSSIGTGTFWWFSQGSWVILGVKSTTKTEQVHKHTLVSEAEQSRENPRLRIVLRVRCEEFAGRRLRIGTPGVRMYVSYVELQQRVGGHEYESGPASERARCMR